MGSPDEPFEFYILLGFDKFWGSFFSDRFDIHESIEKEAFIEIVVEEVVVSLWVEMYGGRFAEFSWLWFIDFYFF